MAGRQAAGKQPALSREEWREQFRELYVRQGMPSEERFDRCRPVGTACADTWKRRLGCKRWTELLEACGFSRCARACDNRNVELTAYTSRTLLPAEDYRRMEQSLKCIFEEYP